MRGTEATRAGVARLAGTAALVALALGACQSMRFGDRGGAGPSIRPSLPEPSEPVVSSVPSGSVVAQPLAPPGGAPAGGDVPVMPGGPRPIETIGSPPPSGPTPAMTRSGAIGGWTAREATGTSCRVNLSSTPSLDLYRASAAGCTNKDLSRVTAWDFRDGEVYLYQPGGAVAARLRPGGGELSGVLAKSGAPLTLTRG